VAMAQPGDLAAIDDVAFATGMRVRVVPASPEAVDRAIEAHLGRSWAAQRADAILPPATEIATAPASGQPWFVSPRGT
jgi:hypothetical protein